MAYVSREQIAPLFSAEFLKQTLDEDLDGIEDAGLFDSLAAAASLRVDGILGLAHAVPFAAPYPPTVVTAATVYVCEALYRRRMGNDAKGNPWAKEAREWDARLEAVARGELPLWPKTAVRGGRVTAPSTKFQPDNQEGL